MALELRVKFELPDLERRELEQALVGLGLLGDVVSWGLERSPRASIAEVIVQDEYNHDVIVELSPDRWLTFETT